MLVRVTARTGLIGAALNVVSRVTIGAFSMAGRVPGAEHREIFVTTPTGDGLFLAELVRLMAADASNVPAFEQCRRRHQRFGLCVTRHARAQRLRGRGVLLLVAGRADLVGGLAVDGMRGLDVLMTAFARSRLWRRVLVRPVAVEALSGVVDLNGRREGLARAVAVSAIARLVRVRMLVFCEVFERLHERVVAETVTQRAVARGVGFQARAGLGRGVLDARFFLVTGGAALGRRGAQLVVADRVTITARNSIFGHVRVVATERSRLAPAERHVHTTPGMRRKLTVTARACQDPCRAEHEREPPPAVPLGANFSRHGAAPGRERPPASSKRTPQCPTCGRAPSTARRRARPGTAADRS